VSSDEIERRKTGTLSKKMKNGDGKSVKDVDGPIQEMGTNMISLNDVVHTLFPPQLGGETLLNNVQELWDLETENQMDLAQRVLEFIHENPGRSKNAIIQQFKAEGFSHSKILEAYHVLLYDKKIIIRMNVGTKSSPRYAHFSSPPFYGDPGRDPLYEVLGPL
jgi:hypothetical protein